MNSKFKLPTNNKNKKRMFNFKEIYEFVYDRFKAVRQDFTINGISKSFQFV
jgi:hypothetical protein